MNILIVGEFSAFSKHLKNGFQELGHNVVVVTKGDGFKQLNGDANDIKYQIPKGLWNIPATRILYAPIENCRLFKSLDRIHRPDLIIVINLVFVTDSVFSVGVPLKYIAKCKKKGTKIISTICGRDPTIAYYPELRYCEDKYPNGLYKYRQRHKKRFNRLLKLSDTIIPIGYDYYYAVNRYCQDNGINTYISHSIPLPITIMETEISSCVGRRIVIFHGIIREDFKGTKYFLEALERIKQEYPDKVEIIVDGKMPYDEYVTELKKMDILLDQTNSYGMGINAELGMMMGKVVFTGNEPENEDDMQLGKSPAINAIPNSSYIYMKLKELVDNPEEIERIKKESRAFALTHLASPVVAGRYIQLIDEH